MENTVTMHVVYRLHQLVHVVLHALLGQVVPSSLDCVVHVHLHQLKNEGESTSRLVVEHFVELDDLGVRR